MILSKSDKAKEVVYLNDKIKDNVKKLKKKYNTSNPYDLIDYLEIERFDVPLGNRLGCYMYLQRSRCIFLNSSIEDDHIYRIVAAHELGHAIQHPKINCSFVKNYTLYSKNTFEIEANKFAAELLLPDEMLIEYQGKTVDQIAAYLNVIPELVKLKFL